ncbi:hypothetical protein GKC68_21370 [Pantoea sp. RSPAM1]|uniref:hypothetical protein n=1 Tax=Pantoea sp. RSPAM1 TaxID=2675223 RepID=UPI00315D78B9
MTRILGRSAEGCNKKITVFVLSLTICAKHRNLPLICRNNIQLLVKISLRSLSDNVAHSPCLARFAVFIPQVFLGLCQKNALTAQFSIASAVFLSQHGPNYSRNLGCYRLKVLSDTARHEDKYQAKGG